MVKMRVLCGSVAVVRTAALQEEGPAFVSLFWVFLRDVCDTLPVPALAEVCAGLRNHP